MLRAHEHEKMDEDTRHDKNASEEVGLVGSIYQCTFYADRREKLRAHEREKMGEDTRQDKTVRK